MYDQISSPRWEHVGTLAIRPRFVLINWRNPNSETTNTPVCQELHDSLLVRDHAFG